MNVTNSDVKESQSCLKLITIKKVTKQFPAVNPGDSANPNPVGQEDDYRKASEKTKCFFFLTLLFAS